MSGVKLESFSRFSRYTRGLGMVCTVSDAHHESDAPILFDNSISHYSTCRHPCDTKTF